MQRHGGGSPTSPPRIGHRPDAGLWEPRKPERRYLHAAVMNWVALDRAIRLFGPREHWCQERDRIVAHVNGPGIHRDGYYRSISAGTISMPRC